MPSADVIAHQPRAHWPRAHWPDARRRRAGRALAGLLLAALPLAGCGGHYVDAYDAPGTWHAQGVNDMNIAAQAANPSDLVRGRSSQGGTVRTAAAAVTNLWSGKSDKAAGAGAAGGGSGVAAAAGAGAAR